MQRWREGVGLGTRDMQAAELFSACRGSVLRRHGKYCCSLRRQSSGYHDIITTHTHTKKKQMQQEQSQPSTAPPTVSTFENPRADVLLTRNFIARSLYSQDTGYFATKDVINDLPGPLEFGSMLGELHYRMDVKQASCISSTSTAGGPL